MSTTTTPVGASAAHDKEFNALLRRLLISVNHVMLVSQHFGDFSSFSEEDAPAGLTLHEAANSLDRLYNEIDAWSVHHEHVAKPEKPKPGLGVFTDDSAARLSVPGLPPALSCPFCGRHDDIEISKTDEPIAKHGIWYDVSCGICGAQAPGAESALQAAQQWNKREIGAATESADEKPVGLGASDKTADRIRAFLMSVRPLRDALPAADQQDAYQLGRVTIERMANASQGTDDPDIVVTLSEAADVLSFLSWIEPFEPSNWWADPENAPSHVCGLEFVLRTLERSLRSREARS